MNAANAVLRGDQLWLWCPACQDVHDVWVSGPGPVLWEWNGDLDAPTISPSILVRYPTKDPHPRNVCHSFVRGGVWEYLSDCTHAQAGQSVQMGESHPDWPDWLISAMAG